MKTSTIVMWFITSIIALIGCMCMNVQHDPWYYVVIAAFSFVSGLFNLMVCVIAKFIENNK